jgi:hypothetical protein
MKKTIVLGLVAAMIVVANGIFAQGPCQMGKKMNKMNPEMKVYFGENILPVLKMQRQELDKELSPAEKSRLDEIRISLKTLREQQRENMDEMRNAKEEPNVAQRKEMREMRNQIHELMNEVSIISEDHDATIKRLMDEIRPQIEQWKEDMQGRMGKDCPYAKDCRGVHKNKGGMHGKQGMHPEGGMMFGKFMAPNAFLLWNPDEPVPFFDESGNLDDNLNLNIFPNPASGKVQISVELEEAAKVDISVFDKDGNEVLTHSPESADAGLYFKTIDTSALTEGLYIIKLNAGSYAAIGRLIVKH